MSKKLSGRRQRSTMLNISTLQRSSTALSSALNMVSVFLCCLPVKFPTVINKLCMALRNPFVTRAINLSVSKGNRGKYLSIRDRPDSHCSRSNPELLCVQFSEAIASPNGYYNSSTPFLFSGCIHRWFFRLSSEIKTQKVLLPLLIASLLFYLHKPISCQSPQLYPLFIF